MTTIASWVNRENKSNISIWTIGDTKVTDANNDVLSLESSKVFELQLKSRLLTGSPEIQSIYYSHSIGFAYAGSSLVGLNCFATLSTIFSNLVGRNTKAIPDLKNLAESAAKVVDYYCKSICSNNNGFEALLYGFCHCSGRPERYYIRKIQQEDNIIYLPEWIAEDEIALLGDRKEEVRAEIINRMNECDDIGSIIYNRTPLQVVNEIVQSRKFPTIGGGSQINIADKYGCEPYQGVKDTDIRFRNIDIHCDIGCQVGDCLIAINGIMWQ